MASETKNEAMITSDLVDHLTRTRVREKKVYMNCAGQLYPVVHVHETDRLIIISPVEPLNVDPCPPPGPSPYNTKKLHL